MFQKRYLQCQMDAFYQTQQAALVMMADMGAPVNSGVKRAPQGRFPPPMVRFRVAGCVVIASLRFQRMGRRHSKQLKPKGTPLCTPAALLARDGSLTLERGSTSKLNRSSSYCSPDSISHVSPMIPALIPSEHHLQLQHATSSQPSSNSHSTVRSKRKPRSHSTVATFNTVPAEISEDPQLTAYTSGLQRLQARLSKMKTPAKH